MPTASVIPRSRPSTSRSPRPTCGRARRGRGRHARAGGGAGQRGGRRAGAVRRRAGHAAAVAGAPVGRVRVGRAASGAKSRCVAVNTTSRACGTAAPCSSTARGWTTSPSIPPSPRRSGASPPPGISRAPPRPADTTFVDPVTGRRHSAMWLVPRSAEDLAARRRVHRLLGGAVVRAHGSHARPRGLRAERVRRLAPALRPRRRRSATTSCASTRAPATRSSTSPTRSCRRRSTARSPRTGTRAVSLPGRGRRARRRHRRPRLAGHRHLRRAGRLALHLLHHAAAAGRRGLRAVVRHADRRPGLRIYPRRPYAATATSVFDYPLSSRFDEVDATVVFDDVFVPWEQVFIYRDVGWSTRSSTSRPRTRWRTSSRWCASP